MQTETCAFKDLDLTDRPNESWEDIPGLEGYYQISSTGRVKRLTSQRRNRERFLKQVAEKILKPTLAKSYNAYTGDTTAYLTITLWLNDQAHYFSVPRLVYFCFVAPFDLKDRNLFIFYKDSDTLNLDPQNLVLGDQTMKQARMEQAGRKAVSGVGKLSPEDRKVLQERINAIKQSKNTYQISRYSLSGKLIESYPNAEVAAKAMHTNAGTLSKATRNVLYTAKGYLWRRGAEPEIDIKPLARVKGIQRSPVVKHLKRLGQYDTNGKLLNTYSSIREASQALKLNFNNISSVVSGKHVSCGGFIWRWGVKKQIDVTMLRESPHFLRSKASLNARKVSQYNLDGVWLRAFANTRSAARETGTDEKSLYLALKGQLMTAGGFLWKRGDQLRLKTQDLVKQPAYKNSALERYHKRKRAAIPA